MSGRFVWSGPGCVTRQLPAVGSDSFRLVFWAPAEVALSSLRQARVPSHVPLGRGLRLSPVISSMCGLSAPSELFQGGRRQDVPRGPGCPCSRDGTGICHQKASAGG